VKRVVVEVATDCAVLNADDPLVLKMSGYTQARSICYVTVNPQHGLAPGRMNVFNEHPFRVLFDYGHNAHAVGAMADIAQRAVWIAPETEN
jgi:UDP-N-acetylmuramyl tripeptide synthase